MRWIRSQVPDFYGRKFRNPITLISQWKILDNLRRSLAGARLVASAAERVAVAAGTARILDCGDFADVVCPHSIDSVLRVVTRSAKRGGGFLPGRAARLRFPAITHSITICSLIFLLHQALISMDAIVRAVPRFS